LDDQNDFTIVYCMNMIRNKNIILAVVVLIWTVSFANVTVEASVDNRAIPSDANINFTISVSGEGLGSVKAPQFPVTDDWAIQGTSSSTSTSVQIINAKMSTTKTLNYIYYLLPQKAGNLIIPTVEVTVKGRKYKTKPLTIHVYQSGTPAPQTPTPTPTVPSSQQSGDEKDIMVSMVASEENVYVGQQVTVDLSLYTRHDLRNVGYDKDAEYNNMWVETIFAADKLAFKPTTIQGKKYYGLLLKSVAAFPLVAGDLTIEPIELTCTVRHAPRSFFDFGKREDVPVRANRIKLHVKPLPSEGKPSSFEGAVGKYSIKSEVDISELKAGEALTYKITVSGDGNIEALTIPEQQFPTDFEIFDKKEFVSKKAKNGKWGGSKRVETILVPRSEGEYEISSLEFSYFDPYKKKYFTDKSESITVKVLPGTGAVNFNASGRSGVVAVGGDIEFIKPDRNSIRICPFNIGWSLDSFWFLPLELLLILLVLSYRHRQEHLVENWRAVKASKALREARKKLSRAQKMKNPIEILGAIYDAIFGYIADKLCIEPGAVIFDEATIHLVEREVSIHTIESLKKTLATIDAARFAPEDIDIDVKELVNDTGEILENIDKTIKE